MITVWKYPINFYGPTELQLPADAKLLAAGIDPHNSISLWVTLNPDMPRITRTVQAFFTGDRVPDDARYISTFVQDWAVVHVFETTERG